MIKFFSNQHVQEILAAAIVVVLQRYALEIAKPSDDLKIIKRWLGDVAYLYWRLRWYRANEIKHQIRGVKILLSCLA